MWWNKIRFSHFLNNIHHSNSIWMYYHVYCYKKDAETIRVRYDSNQLEYKDLLKMFFGFHTPENPSWCGKQYRSAIFTFSEEQNDIAHEVVKEWGALGRFVSIEKASDFYQAEEYHQKYLEKW